MKKIAIINGARYPRAAGQRGAAVVNRLKEVGAEIVFTEYQGHAKEIAKGSRAHNIIIAVGGDGSVSEVVNGMDLDSQSLAIIPAGTGNSLAGDLGIDSIEKALNAMDSGRSSRIDLIKCRFENRGVAHERYVIATSGIGFGAKTASLANRRLKRLGPLCYITAACIKSFFQKTLSAEIRIDDMCPEKTRFTSFFVNNTKRSANVRIFPSAKLDDSMMDLFFAKTNFFTQYLWNMGVLAGTRFYRPQTMVSERLEVRMDGSADLMLDGEVFASVENVVYSVMPGKLSVIK